MLRDEECSGPVNKDDGKSTLRGAGHVLGENFLDARQNISDLKGLPAGTGKTHHLMKTKYTVKWVADEAFRMIQKAV